MKKQLEQLESTIQTEEPNNEKIYAKPETVKESLLANNELKEDVRKVIEPAPRHTMIQSRPEKVARINEIRLGQRGLLISGLLILVLGIGYFLKYSFDQNWVGPIGRVILAYSAGIFLFALGEFFRHRKLVIFGLYMIGGSIATLYFASYAAYQIYGLIPQLVALLLMVCVTSIAGWLAILYNTQWLAVLGIVGGFLTPLVLSSGSDNQLSFMGYMTVLNIGILYVASHKQWQLLNRLAFMCTWVLFAGWYFQYYEMNNFWPTILFIQIFFVTWAMVPFAYHFRRHTNPKSIQDFALTIPNSLIAFGFSFAVIEPVFGTEALCAVTLPYVAFFLVNARYLYRKNRENTDSFVLLLAMGSLYLIATVPLAFSAHWITVFWSLQSIVLLWAGKKLRHKRLVFGALALVSIASVKWIFFDFDAVFGLGSHWIYHSGFFDLAIARYVTAATMLGVVYKTALFLGDTKQYLPPNAQQITFGLFALMLFVFANIETAAFLHEYVPRARFASISILWAVYSMALMSLGFIKRSAKLRRVSIGLFIATMVKIFTLDMANVDTPFRILSFVILGAVLILASYLYHRFKDHVSVDQVLKTQVSKTEKDTET